MTAPRARPNIDALASYRPGRSAEVAMAEHGIADAIKLASNELPFGPLPSVVKAIDAAADRANRYPDHQAGALRAALAERLAVDRDRVTVGCGSVGLLQQLAIAFCGPGDEVVHAAPSFEAYPIFTRLANATGRPVPVARCTIDAAAVAAAVTERTKLVLVANANNPTSTAVRDPDLRTLAEAVPEHCLLVVDEAYREFVTGLAVPDAIDALGERENVAVLRTFSKAYGLAALRVGYMTAAPSVVDAVDKVLIPFSVNALAQAAALASLDAVDELRARVEAVVSERGRVATALRGRGFVVPDSQANFVWLPVGDRAAGLALDLERRGVVTRPFAGHGIRVTIGTPEENDRLLAVVDDGPDHTPAGEWLDRLDAVERRLTALGSDDLDGLTGADPATGEQWDPGQVWAHVAEFGDFWLTELDLVLGAGGAGGAGGGGPVPFGRVKSDPKRIAAIERGRHGERAHHLAAARRSIDRLRARLSELTPEDWRRVGRHSTLGDMDVATQLQHFHVGHYEEHAGQLESLRRR